MHRLMPLTMSLAFSFALLPAVANAQQTPQTENPAVQPPAGPPTSDAQPPGVPPLAPTAETPPPPPPPPPVPPPPPPPPVWQPPPPVQAPVVALPKPKVTTRSLRIGPSMQVQLYEPFPYEKISRVGTGLFGAYEFYLKPSFAIGINLSYRYHPGNSALHQVGYGLLLKHYLGGTSSPDSTFMPYVEYGLLLQINKVASRKGTGTAHDTRLSAGTDMRIAGKIFFIEGSWHYSRLSLFEQGSDRLDNLEFDIGYRYPW